MDHARVIFINVGWMRRYQGEANDEIKGGGKFPEEHKYGHEGLNFLPYDGQCYGMGHVGRGIALERLSAPKGSPYLDDVLVVWVARSQVVGWYKHARLYRKSQNPPTGSNRAIQGDECPYHAVAKESDCKLLAPDARSLGVPRAIGKVHVKGGMGRYVWYAQGHGEYLERLFKFIASEGKSEKKSSGSFGHARQMDPLKRTQVEEAAETKAKEYYRAYGYDLEDVSEKNYGWDLEATKDDLELYVEVKGLSGGNVIVELTANEYRQMKKHRDKYRVCIVTDALSAHPLLSIYAYNPDSERWEHHENGTPINVMEVTGARLYEPATRGHL